MLSTSPSAAFLPIATIALAIMFSMTLLLRDSQVQDVEGHAAPPMALPP